MFFFLLVTSNTCTYVCSFFDIFFVRMQLLGLYPVKYRPWGEKAFALDISRNFQCQNLQLYFHKSIGPGKNTFWKEFSQFRSTLVLDHKKAQLEVQTVYQFLKVKSFLYKYFVPHYSQVLAIQKYRCFLFSEDMSFCVQSVLLCTECVVVYRVKPVS